MLPPSAEQCQRLVAAELAAYEAPGVTYLADDYPVFWESASGALVTDVDGNRFIDLTSAFGVASTGHTNPRVASAVAAQAQRLLHGMGDVHPTALRTQLLARLAKLAPGEVPLTECLKDTVARVLPFWDEAIAPAIQSGQRVLIAAHGNSIRALVKYLDGIADAGQAAQTTHRTYGRIDILVNVAGGSGPIGKSGVESSYGAAGALVVLLVWVYYSAQIFLLGAEFTWVYARRCGSLRDASLK